MVYLPAEDSYLLQKTVKSQAKGDVLEIGTGSGILALTAAEKPSVKSVLAVDIDPKALMYAKKNSPHEKISYKRSDLFSNIPKTFKFDTIIFNPPYLPEDKREDKETALATTGGKKGYEITEKFLKQAPDHLTENSKILLLFSTLTDKERVEQIIDDNLLRYKETGDLKIAFEKLHVYCITKTSLRKTLEKKGITDLELFAHGHRGKIYTGNLKIKNKKQRIAIKMQRKDIEASDTVNNESKVLRILNKKNIGPTILFSGKDYFAYLFVDGEFILNFIERKKPNKKTIMNIIKEVYDQMYILDQLHYNKEEMHHPVKHIIITKKNRPVLLDFERCKKRLKRHNITQFTQFITSGMMLPHLRKAKININKQQLLDLARDYSKDYNKESYRKILEHIK